MGKNNYAVASKTFKRVIIHIASSKLVSIACCRCMKYIRVQETDGNQHYASILLAFSF